MAFGSYSEASGDLMSTFSYIMTFKDEYGEKMDIYLKVLKN